MVAMRTKSTHIHITEKIFSGIAILFDRTFVKITLGLNSPWSNISLIAEK